MAAIFETIAAELPALGAARGVEHGLLVVKLPPAALMDLARRLKGEWRFYLLLDVTAIDWPQRAPRFDVVWHFYSTQHRVRVRLRTQVTEEEPVVDSLTPLYGSAAFAERECHEMYGIRFRGNADLRPLLLYEGFAGHPLRKDYPKEREQPLVPYREGRA